MTSGPLELQRRLGDLLVEHGLAQRGHVDECLKELEDLAEQGKDPLPSLLDLLVRKHYARNDIYQTTMRLPGFKP
jgi:cytosine/adenosine deaminase-related metal-dependent hydrolase